MTFWDGPLENEKTVWTEIYDLKEKQNNIRRGLFSRYDFMKKELCSLKAELAELRQSVNTKPDNKIFDYDELKRASG